jgi:hypothetical protein
VAAQDFYIRQGTAVAYLGQKVFAEIGEDLFCSLL